MGWKKNRQLNGKTKKSGREGKTRKNQNQEGRKINERIEEREEKMNNEAERKKE